MGGISSVFQAVNDPFSRSRDGEDDLQGEKGCPHDSVLSAVLSRSEILSEEDQFQASDRLSWPVRMASMCS